MADYYPLIAKGVTGLAKSTGEARRAVYDRARAALLSQLRAVKPALSEPDITRERLALEEAIRLVEAEVIRDERADLPPEIRQLNAIQRRVNGTERTPPRDNQPSHAVNPQRVKARWGYLDVGGMAGSIVGILTFIGAYVYCVVTYGFLLGMGLGWLPSGILASIAYVATLFLWLPILIFAGLAVCIFLSEIGAPGPAATGGLILLFVIAIIFSEVRFRR